MLANIIENTEISRGYFRLILHSAGLAENTKPGQFVMVKVGKNYDPLLRRPMGLYKISSKDNNPCVELLYQVVGKGTTIMSKMKKGQQADMLGPFGNGFTIPQSGRATAQLPDKNFAEKTQFYKLAVRNIKAAVFVAGGIGIAPLVMLAEKMVKEIPNLKTYLFIGGKSKNDILCIDDFGKLNTEICITTEDGSLENKGLVTDPVKKFIDKKADSQTLFFACGPYRMLKAVSELTAKKDIPCQVSLDRRMACGFGVCLGCVIKVNSENGSHYKNVCTDGPVFDAKEICW